MCLGRVATSFQSSVNFYRKSISVVMGACLIIKVLHLHDNLLPTLPVDFDQLNKLSDLRLHNNPLRTPPMDVCVSGVLQPIGRFIRRAVEREGKDCEINSLI